MAEERETDDIRTNNKKGQAEEGVFVEASGNQERHFRFADLQVGIGQECPYDFLLDKAGGRFENQS